MFSLVVPGLTLGGFAVASAAGASLAVPGGGPGPVLAVLIGVNIGPNLTYTGSLATLLWRRVLRESGADVALGKFTRFGAATVVPALLLCVISLWLSLRV